MSVSKYLEGIPDDVDPEFMRRAQTDITGTIVGLYAHQCRERTTNTKVFIDNWEAMTVDQRRQKVFTLYPYTGKYFTEQAIDKILNFVF